MAKETVQRAWLPHDGLVTPPADDDLGWHAQPTFPVMSDSILEDLQKQGYTWVSLELIAARPRRRQRSIKALLWGIV